MSNNTPIGPAWFIFFQDGAKVSSGGGSPKSSAGLTDNDRRKQDDEEILLIIQLAVSYKLI